MAIGVKLVLVGLEAVNDQPVFLPQYAAAWAQLEASEDEVAGGNDKPGPPGQLVKLA
jgi:hypothetical protein